MSSLKGKIFILCLFGLFYCSAANAGTQTFTIVSGTDDAYQKWGTLYDDGTSLPLLNGGVIGLRFDNVTISSDTEITSAKLVITSDNTVTDNGKYLLYIEDNVDPDDYSTSNVTDASRTYHNSWQDQGRYYENFSISGYYGNQDTTWSEYDTKEINVKGLIETILDTTGWNSGQAMAFKIEKNAWGYYDFDWDSSYFSIYSSEGSATYSAQLIIETESNLSLTTSETSLDTSAYTGYNAQDNYFTLYNNGNVSFDYSLTNSETWIYCSNTTGTLAAGASAKISVAYANSLLTADTYTDNIVITATNGDDSASYNLAVSLTVMDPDEGTACGNVPIYAQNLVDPAILILLDVSGSMDWDIAIEPTDANTEQTPDLSDLIDVAVQRSDWVAGNSIAFRFSQASYGRDAYAYDNEEDYAPKLYIEYTYSGTAYTFSSQILSGYNDAEYQYSWNGWYKNTWQWDSSETQLNFGDNVIGLRFTGIDIPQGADITSAYIEFTTISDNDATASDNNITIAIEDTDDADYFYEDGTSKSWISSTTVTWNANDEWEAAETARKIDIAQSVIGQLVEDDAISWGFGEWSASKPHASDTYQLYTQITAGVMHRDDEEVEELQDIIAETTPGGGTPLESSMEAGLEYFLGNKADTDGNYYDTEDTDCQPKFLIEITDGLGNTDESATTDGIMTTRTNNLADNNISTIAVGFGIDDATQIQEIAAVANERGNADDDIYALHEEDEDGVGQPFLANSQTELYTALNSITDNIKKQIFIGASPSPTTSADYGTFVLNATFNAGSWTGDITAIPYDPDTGDILMCVDSTGAETCEQDDIVGTCAYEEDGQCLISDIAMGNFCICWTASEQMPAVGSMNAWTVAGENSTNGSSLSVGDVGTYVDSTTPGSQEIDLDGDSYICKDLGDIIKSTPVIVDPPGEAYSYDNYAAYKYSSLRNRTDMVYVGANDGALHAFNLNTGVEEWRFYPEALHTKLKATDICDDDYCHESFVDATPVVEDIYLGTDSEYSSDESYYPAWRTMLMVGLGEGGDAFFALDISSSKNFDLSSTGALTDAWSSTQYLWQFTDSELGETTGVPVIAKVSTTTADDGGFAAYFGSGEDVDGSNYKEAYVYGINAYTADPIWVSGEADRIGYESTTVDLSTSTGSGITGASSGATATISSLIEDVTGVGGSGTLILESMSGDFITGEGILIDGTTVAGVSQPLFKEEVYRVKLEPVDRIAYSGRIEGNSFAAGQTVKGATSEATAVISEVVQADEATYGTLILDTASISGTFIESEDLQVETDTDTFEKYSIVSYVLHSAYSNDALSDMTLADLDYNNLSDYMYIGSMYGRLYRIDSIGYGEEPDIDTLFDVHPSSIDRSTPIRAGAAISYDEEDDTVWIYFGTGKFEDQADKFNTDQQYFIGLKDNLASPTTTQTLSDLLERTTVAVTATVNGVEDEYRTMTGFTYTFTSEHASIAHSGVQFQGEDSGVVGTVASVDLDENLITFDEDNLSGSFSIGETLYNTSDTSETITLTSSPWYATLQYDGSTPSERVVSRSLVVDNIVFFTSFIPDDDVCAGSGSAWLYALDYDTGLPANSVIFDINDDGAYGDDDKINGQAVIGIPIGRGIPSAPILEGDVILVNTTDSGGDGDDPPGPTIIKPNLPGLKAAITAWKDGTL